MRIEKFLIVVFCLSNTDIYPHGSSAHRGFLLGVDATQDNAKHNDFKHGDSRSESKDSQRSHLLTALQVVQRQMTNKSRCASNESVLDIAFDHARWKSEALLAVEVANLLTSLWPVKTSDNFSMVENDTFLYNLVRSNVHFSPSVFGSVVCFEKLKYRNYKGFCPYAFRDKTRGGAVHVKDISVGHDYLNNNDTIWWWEPRQKALNRSAKTSTDIYSVRLNASVADLPRNVSVPLVQYEEDGYWTRPYYDCAGGEIWMITFLAPFFDDANNFLGVVSIDVELSSMDINQCDAQPSTLSGGRTKSGNSDRTESTDSAELLEFLGTHKCKTSTQCEPITNQGFKRGSYRCTCKKGFYFPDHSATVKAFNGSTIEEEYDRKLQSPSNFYDDDFECVACSEGCEECADGSACVYVTQDIPRLILLTVNVFFALMAIIFGTAVFAFRNHKVFEAACPVFLGVIVIATLLMYASVGVSFAGPSDVTCLLEEWLYHCGFYSIYGTLVVKVWRVAACFRARSPRRVDVTDAMMAGRLVGLVTIVLVFLFVWTFVCPPQVVSNVSGLRFEHCSTNLMTYLSVCGNFVLLVIVMFFCFRVRNAPSPYNENRYISWAVYNSLFVVCFVALLRFLTTNNTNPDILFGMSFILVHMTATVTLLLLFIPKIVLLRKARAQGVSRRLTNRSSRGSLQSPNGVLVNDISMLERENDDLKEEVKRLAVKVAFLKSRLMKDKNKHLKSGSTGHCRARSSNNDDCDGTQEKLSSSPVTKFLSSRV